MFICLSVPPSVLLSEWKNSALIGRIFIDLTIIRKSLENIQVPYNSDKNNWYLA